MRNNSLEEMYLHELVGKMSEAEKVYSHKITTHTLERDDYLRTLGYIQAIREMREEIHLLRKAFFPDT
jgi:hypothetical protein